MFASRQHPNTTLRATNYCLYIGTKQTSPPWVSLSRFLRVRLATSSRDCYPAPHARHYGNQPCKTSFCVHSCHIPCLKTHSRKKHTRTSRPCWRPADLRPAPTCARPMLMTSCRSVGTYRSCLDLPTTQTTVSSYRTVCSLHVVTSLAWDGP